MFTLFATPIKSQLKSAGSFLMTKQNMPLSKVSSFNSTQKRSLMPGKLTMLVVVVRQSAQTKVIVK